MSRKTPLCATARSGSALSLNPHKEKNMPSQNGRDLLLKIGDGGEPETFITIGAARTVEMSLDNQPVDATAMNSEGISVPRADAGVQSLAIMLQGLFKDSAAEELLRAAAFNRTANNYRLLFPNGANYAASFVIGDYRRSGSYEGLESFTVTLLRSGAGTYTGG
jgi:predicted secreted protein